MKAVVAAFNQEKALVGAFSVITNLRMELFEALMATGTHTALAEAGAGLETITQCCHCAGGREAEGGRGKSLQMSN